MKVTERLTTSPKKNICMKVRLYHDERVSAKDAPDAWSIYCPYPKKYQRVTGIKGVQAYR